VLWSRKKEALNNESVNKNNSANNKKQKGKHAPRTRRMKRALIEKVVELNARVCATCVRQQRQLLE
jgi:hypothetical protein